MQIKIILIKKNALKSSSQKPLNQIGLGCSLVFCILSLPLMSLIRLISMQVLSKEEFEDTKEIIRICKSKGKKTSTILFRTESEKMQGQKSRT
jgi:hypothetical protein